MSTSTKQSTTLESVAKRIFDHLSGDGTYNDSDTEDLYSEAHGIEDAETVDSDVISRWAVETAQAYAIAKARAK